MVATFFIKRKKLIGDIVIAVLLLLVFCFKLFLYFDYKLQDAAFQKPSLTNPEIVILGIDAEALSDNEFGRFQDWDRQIMADAINILNSGEYKPAVIAVDVLYAGESGNKTSDENLAQAAADGGNVVLASIAHFDDELSLENDMEMEKVLTQYEIPFPLLAQNAVYGMANGILSDVDGVIRSAPLKTPYREGILRSFAYEIYNKYMEHTGGEISGFIEESNEVYLTYSGKPTDYFIHSFADIFKEDFDPDYFADCIVFIGPYESAFMDSYYTPMSQDMQMYGVEIHANTVQMMLEEKFKTYISWEINFAILFAFVITGVILIRFVDIRVLLAIFAVLGAGYFLLALYIFSRGYILSLIYPLISLAVMYIYQLIYGYVLEAIEKQKLKSAFKKYVDPKLVDKLIESGEANSNEVGVKKNIAVLFVDVRGFTPMTEALKDEPELVVKILNEYLELTSSSVFNNDGSVDKFVGDATMALFNGFFPTDDYVFKAVKAAWDMVQGAVEVNASIKAKYKVDIGFGIGINCGDAIVGNLGPSFRKDYTAIGDTVNTAARLESNAKCSEILISAEVYNLLKNKIEASSVGEIPLKGKSIKLEVFSVTNIIE